MPSKKKKYNARFPPARIKKIMQTDEEVGKVAAAVPVIISRALELFVESLLTKAVQITSAKNAKTLSPAHLKQCILAESRFDFLKDLVLAIPDVQAEGEEGAPVTPTSSTAPQTVTFRQVEPSSSTSGRGRGTGRPRGRPRKVPGAASTTTKHEQRKKQSDDDETDSDSEDSYDDDDETDTDSAPKAAPATKNGQSVIPQKSTQFNAVQPNFYQEISASNNSTPFEIKISLPPASAVSDVTPDDQNKPTAEDDDYDT